MLTNTENGKPNLLPNGNYRYKKFVHKNGQLEVIVDTKDGILSADDYNRIVTNSTNAGSYNYYHPNNQQIGHKDYDVDNDYALYKSNQIKTIIIPEGYFCIIPNHLAHMAMYGISNSVKKIVIKIPAS